MFGYKKIVIADYERGLKFEDRRLVAVLDPGVHGYFDWSGRIAVNVVNIEKPRLQLDQADFLIAHAREDIAAHFERVELSMDELAVVYRNRQMIDLVPPGKSAVFWTLDDAVEIHRIDVAEELSVTESLARELLVYNPVTAKRYLTVQEIADYETGQLIVDGVLTQTLAPGFHAFWTVNRHVLVRVTDNRVQSLEVNGQEILTRDKVSLRINLMANYRITDADVARQAHRDIGDHLYRELQFALRQIVATHDLAHLLANKGEIDKVVFRHTTEAMADKGIALSSVGVRDIILPGDMKQILNRVVEAEKIAEANVIRRREETAATRSLLNTAKLMENNPTLLRLKELEVLENVTGKIDQITVFGGLDGLMNDVINIGKPGKRKLTSDNGTAGSGS